MRYEPRSWGRRAIKFVLQNARVALWATPGIGKTAITLASVMLLRQRKLVKSALVVAPLAVVNNTWRQEAEKWEQFKDMRIVVLHGANKKSLLLGKDNVDLYVVNYEGLPWLVKTMNDHKMWKNEKQPFDMIVLDEASKTKNPSSQRFKLLKGMSVHFRRVLELTGSPAPNGLKDIWSQVYLLDEGASLGRFKTHFYNQYFFGTAHEGDVLKLKPHADEAIYDAIEHLVLRMDATDYMDLPELVVNDIKVDLPDEVKKLYKELESKLILKLEDATVSPVNAAAGVNKCLQLTGGGVYDDDGKTVHWVHDAKISALDGLIDELGGQPLLVGTAFRHTAAHLRTHFRADDVAFIEGGMRDGEVTQIIERWNKGLIRVLFAQMQVVSHGLNLQLGGAHNLCFYDLTWDLEVYEQLIARLWRQGQKNNVFVHRLLCKGTVDIEVARALKEKDTTQKNLLDALKGRQ